MVQFRRRGISLVETLVVLALMAVIVGFLGASIYAAFLALEHLASIV
jgi:prepilin-type N-terminal cleavage/methylation domain-containing protein